MIDDRKKEDTGDVILDQLAQKLANLMIKVSGLEQDMIKQRYADNKMSRHAVDELKLSETLKVYEKRLEVLSRRLQTYINRECILTEVTGYVRRKGSADLIVHFSNQLMIAYDWDDEFWEQKGANTFTIREWYDRIMELEPPTPKDYNVALMLPK